MAGGLGSSAPCPCKGLYTPLYTPAGGGAFAVPAEQVRHPGNYGEIGRRVAEQSAVLCTTYPVQTSIVGSLSLRMRPAGARRLGCLPPLARSPLEWYMISRIARFFSNDPYHVILFALPWLLLAVNVNWPFGNGHNCDPWFYWGHCQAFPKLFLSNPCYDGERLSVILPGYLFHHI